MGSLEGGSSHLEREARAAKKDIKSKEFFRGPLKGLVLAPEFFGLLGSPDFSGNPLGLGLRLQEALLKSGISGLQGGRFRVPKGVASASREQLGSELAAFGIETSPAAAIAATERFTGISEQVRNSRISQALQILNSGGGAGSIFPSASEFLQLGANQQLGLANVRLQGAQATQARSDTESAATGQLLGLVAALGLGAATGGLGLLPGLAAGGAGALGGAGIFSGLIPPGIFQRGTPPGTTFTPQQVGQFNQASALLQSPFILPP